MCEQCISFMEYYNSTNQPLIITEAIKASILLANTDKGRLNRGKYEVKRTTNILKHVEGKNIELIKIEWTNRAEPSSEQRTHAGYVVFDNHSKDCKIYELWCDCQDFFFDLWKVYNDDGMSPWKLDPKFEKRNILRANANGGKYLTHNKQAPKYDRTNKDGVEFLCKHLVNIIWYYVMGKFKSETGEFDNTKEKNIIKTDKDSEIVTNKKPSKLIPMKKAEVNPKVIKPIEKEVKSTKMVPTVSKKEPEVKPIKKEPIEKKPAKLVPPKAVLKKPEIKPEVKLTKPIEKEPNEMPPKKMMPMKAVLKRPEVKKPEVKPVEGEKKPSKMVPMKAVLKRPEVKKPEDKKVSKMMPTKAILKKPEAKPLPTISKAVEPKKSSK